MAQQLYITHPDAQVNDRQRQELEILSGEAKTFMARLFVLGNAVYPVLPAVDRGPN